MPLVGKPHQVFKNLSKSFGITQHRYVKLIFNLSSTISTQLALNLSGHEKIQYWLIIIGGKH